MKKRRIKTTQVIVKDALMVGPPYPANSDFQDGYKAAMQAVLEIINYQINRKRYAKRRGDEAPVAEPGQGQVDSRSPEALRNEYEQWLSEEGKKFGAVVGAQSPSDGEAK